MGLTTVLCVRVGVPVTVQDEDVDGARECTRIGAVRLVDIHKYNEGITWGVDDLDRRRNIVMERCVIADKSFGCVTTA